MDNRYGSLSYIPMVKGINESKWTGNGLRFATPEEALAYAADLQGRWMGCKGGAENRMALESTDPVSHVWDIVNHRMEALS